MKGGCHVYLLRAGPYAKIGITNDIARRVSQLRTACPERIEVASSKWVCCRGHAADIEYEFHTDLKVRGYHTSGEWFAGDAIVESFFEQLYGRSTSLCCDQGCLIDTARLFVGVPMGPVDTDLVTDTPLYSMGGNSAWLAPPSVDENGFRMGYALGGGWLNEPVWASGWYVQDPNVMRVIGFDGTWTEFHLARLLKAINDERSVLRNATMNGCAYQLPARATSCMEARR